MGKESSVAPKERVNIRYKPATGDMKEEVELPLKLLMVGDYTLADDDTPLENRQRINIDKDNFQDVMSSMNLNVQTSVKNTLVEGDDEELPVDLKFRNLKDFEPENVARQVPELNKLLALREALNALRGPLGNVPAFRKKIQELVEDDASREKLLNELNLATGDKGGDQS